MANSREQCLDEDAAFLPVTASSPEFLHCEKERQAVERLLSAGPEAFYSSIGTERSGCFLSTEEVNKISSWAQDYQLQELRQAHGKEANSEEDFCSTYFPSNTDTPTPNLELGWPPKGPWMQKGSFTVHTSPPAEGEPAVREIIRRTLQKASQVIAIVTDRLTDGAIIGDLHNAASRGVPVYVILNQRSVQENYTLHRLRHPNIRVRVLGGKSFCSRMGRMVVGEMKNKFLLVDLETAIHGSYSFTWTDAHLHRQLITVLRGPAVDLFDKEFRILFAASLPAPDTCRVAGTHVDVGHQLKDLSNLRFENHLPLDPDITGPPSPYADFLLDWETMGVFQKDPCSPDSLLEDHEKIWLMKMQQQNNIPCDENSPLIDSLTYNGNQLVDERSRLTKTTSPVINKLPENSTTLNYTESSSIHLTPEKMNRVDILIQKALTKINNLDESTTTLDHKSKETTHNMAMQSSSKLSSREPFLEEMHITSDALFSRVENAPSSRKPLILKLPQSESFSSLSDIMKRFYPQQSSSGLLKKGPKTALAELSQSMTELSTHTTDTNDFPVPKLNANCFHLDNLTPAFALMKKRDNDLKHKLFSIPKDVMLGERPRSSRYGLDWRRSLAEREGNQETEARK